MAIKVRPGQAGETQDAQDLAEKAARDLDGEEHEQILSHRERFAEIAYGIMQSWVGFIMVVVAAQFGLRQLGIGLTEAEFIAVVTTTTSAVFGFGFLVGNFLFPKGGSGKKRA